MSETLATPSAEQLNNQFSADFDATPSDATEQSQELSPFGAKLVRAADRINSILENKAQGKIDKRNQDEAFGSYEENVEHSEALDQQWQAAEKQNQKYYRQEARQEKVESAKTAVRKVGRSVLRSLKSTGYIASGTALLAGEAVGRGANKAASKIESTISKGVDYTTGVADAYRESQAYKQQAAEKRAEANLSKQYEREAARTNRKNEQESARQERIALAHERALERAAAAKARKEARQEKWQATKDTWATRKETAIDKASEFADQAKAKKVALGRAAIGARNAATAGAKAAHTAGREAWQNR